MRSLLLTGARQTGKTTLYRQAIRRLIGDGYPAENVLYATFDHPILKLAGLNNTIEAWNSLHPRNPGRQRILFLDEIQYVPDWQVWLKHQVDFRRRDRVAVTGSASPLRDASAESGVGRWETIPLATLSFGEFLKLRRIDVPELPEVTSLRTLFDWSEADFARETSRARELTAHFHQYLVYGGFPEPALVSDLSRCQRLLREDIVEKVLKRDMTALYGVRRVIEVEKLFLYLCYHDGGILDLGTISKELDGVTKRTVQNYLDLFESTHLVHRLRPFGYGKEILRGREKAYLADAALPGAVLLLGKRLLELPDRLGAAVETAFFKHLYTRYYREMPTFSYWRDRKNSDLEVDIIADLSGRLVPFEVKYQGTSITGQKLRGLRLFMEQRGLDRGYVITQRWEDFGVMNLTSAMPGKGQVSLPGKVLKLPAPLACFWLSN